MNAVEKSPLYVYNSLSKTKELFEPLHKNYVGMYVCGPTVYSDVHLGNVRTFICFDMIYRYLQHLGYKLRYVRNITDAGHLEDDSDDREDKIAKKARIEQLEPMEVVQKYTLNFHHILKCFNTLSPNIEPTATGHIIEQIQIIKDLLKKGLAYQVAGSVYFDVLEYQKKGNYGILSGRDIEQAIHNTRSLEGQTQKKNPQDFALWKKADASHIMRWESPWSDGFPGWHLECTAMSQKYLGKCFDIHGGGMDLKFPHHECEIAQGKAHTGKDPVKYWLHTNMLTLNGQKMSKSTGNHILPAELFNGESIHLSKGYSPSVVRFFMMQAHYRNVLDFSDTALQASEKGFYKLMQALEILEHIKPQKESTWQVIHWIKKCYQAMSDDFNTPVLIAHLFEAVKQIYLMKEKATTVFLKAKDLEFLKATLHVFVFNILGLQKQSNHKVSEKLSETIGLLIDLRNEARENKNWELSDTIRNKLLALGVQLKDGEQGTTFDWVS